MPLRCRISTRSTPDGVGQLVHQRLVGERGLHAAEPAHGAARRVVGEDAVGVDRDRREPVGPEAQRAGVADDRARSTRRRRRRRAARRPWRRPGCRRARRRTRRSSSPGAGARGRRRTPRGRSPSSPACRCAAPAGRRGRASTGPRGRRTRRRRRPASAAPSRAACPGPGRSGAGRRAATGWRRRGRRRRPRPGRRARTPGPRKAWSCMPTSKSSETTTGAVGVSSPRRSFRCRTRLPGRCTAGASGSIARRASVTAGSTS